MVDLLNTKRQRDAVALEIQILNDLHNHGGLSDRLYERALRELEREYAESSDIPLHR